MLRKRFGKVWERLNQGKRELKGLMGKIRKERKKKRWNKNSPRLWRVKMGAQANKHRTEKQSPEFKIKMSSEGGMNFF